MPYNKPQLVPLPGPIESIQGGKDYGNPTDSGNVKITTLNAYEADE
jgi:hypothetical protein